MHKKEVCEVHMSVLLQCKCPGPHTIFYKPCPGEEKCKTYALEYVPAEKKVIRRPSE